MDTLAPQSVLDRRTRERTRIVLPDRLTRHQSPVREQFGCDSDEVVIPSIPQPYRTSFSAVTAPTRINISHSRSLSPLASSMKSDRSQSKSPVERKVSPKHVTIDTRVKIRHSDSFEDYGEQSDMYTDSVCSDLDTDGDLSHTNGRSQLESCDSEVDYSSQIREMTEMIVNEYSTPGELNITKGKPPPPTKPPTSGYKKTVPAGGGSGVPNGRLPPRPNGPKAHLIHEYKHDRLVSYRQAISNHYSPEVNNLADSIMEENYAAESKQDSSQPKLERSNSVPLQPETEQEKLTPRKKTLSGSIGNFFRRMSPMLGRKKRGSRHGSTSSVSDSGHGNGSEENLSRNKVRSSFMKFINRGNKSKLNSTNDESSASNSTQTPESAKQNTPKSEQNIPASSSRMLRSIEQNSMSEQDVYHKFKDRQSPGHDTSVSFNRSQPLRASGDVTPHIKQSSMDKQSPHTTDIGDIPDIVRDVTPSANIPPKKPPRLPREDVSQKVVKRTPRDRSSCPEEISMTEYAVDPNFTTSEPSLLSNPGSLGANSDHLDNRSLNVGSDGVLSPIAASTPSVHLKPGRRGENTHDVTYSSMPKLADSADISIPECNKSPSYLKLSCSVSGYGRFSQYSSYKDIEKRSPYSSVSSSRSDLLSPDMPATKIMSPVQRTSSGENGYELGLISPQPLGGRLGSFGDCNGVSNGLNLSEESYPTGEPKLDGEYFLRVTQAEENRLLSHCQHVEADLHCCDVPEEASGKIRAAIGKAKLLVNKKCKQFRELCLEHMDPSEDAKLLKWEDLQGFWDMIKLQIDNVDEMFTEIEISRQNGWKDLNIQSQASSANSSPKSGSLSLSNASTPSGTPGTRRKALKCKDTPESSPERTEKMRQAAKAREDARKKMLAEKRAAMRQKKTNQEVEIFVPEIDNK